MKRNIVLSAVIGTLAAYLPFWEWENSMNRIVGIISLGVITFIILLWGEEVGKHGKRS